METQYGCSNWITRKWWNYQNVAPLDQIITWRDLGFIYCHHDPNYATYDSLSEGQNHNGRTLY